MPDVIHPGQITVKYQGNKVVFHPETELDQIVDFLEHMSSRVVKQASDQFESNYVLPLNYWAIETDTGKLKCGNGVYTWDRLPYVGGQSTASGTANPPLQKTLEEWNEYEFVIPKGTLCFTTDAIGLKIGDGENTWKDLPYTIHKEIYTPPFVIEALEDEDADEENWEKVDPMQYGLTDKKMIEDPEDYIPQKPGPLDPSDETKVFDEIPGSTEPEEPEVP